MLFKIPVENCFVTSRFGEYRNYSFAPKRKQLHEGIDYAPALKDRDAVFLVRAANTGTVFTKGFDAKGYGNFVVIQHDSPYFTWYAHLESPSTLKVGDVVDTESIVGVMGSTGNATGKHLHFTLQDVEHGANNYVVPKVIDPLPLMVNKIDTCNISEIVYNVLIRLIH